MLNFIIMDFKSDAPPESCSTWNYSDLYKCRGTIHNQLDRRTKLLSELKKRRNDQVDQLRGIVDIFNDEEIDEPEDVVKYYKKRHKNYGGKIMMSEWMSEVPTDLHEEWLFKICPVGTRHIVVANRGATKAYNRRNKLKGIFQSNLPGGSHNNKSHNFTLLDCVYRHDTKTYYVLDVLVWNSFSLLKCSTEFRFFFLKSKLEESSDLELPSKFNFSNIDYHPAELGIIEMSFTNPIIVNDQELPIDGVLFYHKNCIYMSGPTPLVGWLKPYMIPEKLEIPVHSSYMLKKPKQYVNLEQYLNYVKDKYKKTPKRETSRDEDTIEMEEESFEENEGNAMDELG